MEVSPFQNNTLATSNGYSMSLKEMRETLLPIIEKQRFRNEDAGFNLYHDFNDEQILFYYLIESSHIDNSKARAEDTVNKYKSILLPFLQNFHENPDKLEFTQSDAIWENQKLAVFKSLKRKHIHKYIECLQAVQEDGKVYSPATMSLYLSVIKSFLKQLHTWEYITAPLHNYFPKFSLDVTDRPNRDIGPEIVNALLKMFKDTENFAMYTYILFLTTTGIRNREMCNLRISDIHQTFYQGQPSYYIHIVAKGKKIRNVPLLPRTVEVIQEYRTMRGMHLIENSSPNEPVFVTNRMKAYTPSYLAQVFKKNLENLPAEYREQLKQLTRYYEFEVKNDSTSKRIEKHISITPHGLRHAFAIISRKSDVSVDTIKESLGHADRRTTEIYLESITQHESNAVHQWNTDLLNGNI